MARRKASESERKHWVQPPQGVPINPPDDVPATSILNYAAPTLDEVTHLKQNQLSILLETADVKQLEQRICLLARLLIEKSLWEAEGMTKKERADLALGALRQFEGAKSNLWVQDEGDVKVPKSVQAFKEEKEAMEKRLAHLIKHDKDIRARQKELAAASLAHVEAQNALHDAKSGDIKVREGENGT